MFYREEGVRQSLLERILSEYVENKDRIISLLDKKAEVSLEEFTSS